MKTNQLLVFILLLNIAFIISACDRKKSVWSDLMKVENAELLEKFRK